MTIKESWKKFGLYAGTATALIVMGLLAYGFGSNSFADQTLFGWKLSDLATLNDAGEIIAKVIVAAMAALFVLGIVFRYVLRNYFRPAVGRHQIDGQARGTLAKGLNGQLDFLAGRSCWPAHDATAKAASSAIRIDFGDALLTTSRRDLATIQAFLTHPLRDSRTVEMEQSVLVIRGEPGAGKSILTQELHASLVRGINNENHSLIPIILYAADLCLEDFQPCEQPGTPFQEFLARKLTRSSCLGDVDLSSFVSASWNNHDFVVLVDGLDEIAQRESYSDIQDKLKDLIGREISQSGQRVRRFIMSCRTHDHLDVYPNSPLIELRGLTNAEERQRFCDQLVKRHSKGDTDSKRLSQALRPESTQLTSHDLFRRNPYFLTLLIKFYSDDPNHAPVMRQATFEHIMNSYIKREAIRATQAYGGSPDADGTNESLFSSVYTVSAIVLKYMAGSMSTHGVDSALYNKFEIDSAMLANFGKTVVCSAPESNEPWKRLFDFGANFARTGSIAESDISDLAAHGVLTESDLRLIRDCIAEKDLLLEDRIHAAFGTIPRYAKSGDPAFYRRLASHLAQISNDAATSPVDLLWILVFARGLAGAHSLKLVYVDWTNAAPEVSFRHRRLAEYFAACYFRDRWSETPWKRYSPWHTPVFNLVAAIEGERCLAFELITSYVTEQVPDRAYEWRSSVVDAAEVSAFAERSGRFEEIAGQLLERLTVAMKQLTQKDGTKIDIASQFSVVNALGFMGDIGISLAGKPSHLTNLLEEQIANLPAPLFNAKIKAANAIEQMTSRSRSLDFRLGSMWDLIAYPNGLATRFASVRNSGGAAEFLLVGLLFVVAELILLAGLLFAGAKIVLLTVSTNAGYDTSPVLFAVLLPLAVLIIILRILQWRTSPRAARVISMAITHPVAGLVVSLIAGWEALLMLVRNFPQAIARLIGWFIAVVRSIPLALKVLARLIFWIRQKWIELALGVILLGLVGAAVYGVILLGVSTWQMVRIETVSNNSSTSAPSLKVETRSVTPTQEPKQPIIASSHSKCEEVRTKAAESIDIAQRGWATAEELAVMRRKLAIQIRELTAMPNVQTCIDWWGKMPPSMALAYAKLNAINPGAIPLPAWSNPSFKASDFDELERQLDFRVEEIAAESAAAGWFDLSAAPMFRRASEADEMAASISELSAEMEAALQTGEITNLPNAEKPNDVQFLTLFMEVHALSVRSKSAQKELRRQAKSYYKRAQNLLIRLLIVVAILALAIIVGRKWHVDRRDNAKIAAAQKLPFASIIQMIKTENLSDRVRLKLVYILREQPAGEDIAISVEDLAQTLGATGSKRDTNLSIELARAAGFLSARTRS